MTVGRGLRDDLARDHAARAGPVVDDDRLAPALRELLPDDTRHDVREAARRKRDEYANRFARISLRDGSACEHEGSDGEHEYGETTRQTDSSGCYGSE
jgi:hypothetical protein